MSFPYPYQPFLAAASARGNVNQLPRSFTIQQNLSGSEG